MKENETGSGSESEDDKTKKRGIKKEKNVLKRMEDVQGPMALLLRAVQEKLRVRVITRNARHVRGICTGFLLAFDWHCNLAMMDVDEAYKNPREKPRVPKPRKKRRNRKKKKQKAVKDEDQSEADLMGYPSVSQIDGLFDSSEDEATVDLTHDPSFDFTSDEEKKDKGERRRPKSPPAARHKSREKRPSPERSRRKRSKERSPKHHHSRHSTERHSHGDSRRQYSSTSSRHSRKSRSLSPVRSHSSRSSRHRHESPSRRRSPSLKSRQPPSGRSLRSFIDENLKNAERSPQRTVTKPREPPTELEHKPCRVRMTRITVAELEERGLPAVHKVQEYCPVLERHVKQLFIRGDNIVLVSIAD